MQGCHFVRIFVIDRPFAAADVVSLGIARFDCRERLGQRLEIAGIMEPTLPHPLIRSAQPPKLGRVGFEDAVDVGGDLDTWCHGWARLITGNFYAVGQVCHSRYTYRLMILPAFSLPSFAGGITGVASGLPLGFHGGFPR